MSDDATDQEQSEQESKPPGSLREFKGKDERAKDRVWKTGFIVVQDEDGRVFVNNSLRHFKDTVTREAGIDDAIYMLQTALDEFKQDKVMMNLKSLLEGALREPT